MQDAEPRKILSDLVNVRTDIEAGDFLKRYGPLRSQTSDVIELASIAGSALPTPLEDVIGAAEVFRQAWPPIDLDAEVMQHFLEQLFRVHVNGPHDHPAVRLNIDTWRWEPVPRNLIERLAVEYVKDRKMLHRCERPECQRFFVKQFSRDKYCRLRCSDEMRSRGQSEWQRKHQQELNARRRKPKRRRGTAA